MNLTDHPWSHRTGSSKDPRALACEDPSTEGILVIDDRTGAILGVLDDQRLRNAICWSVFDC